MQYIYWLTGIISIGIHTEKEMLHSVIAFNVLLKSGIIGSAVVSK